jgi:oxygen-independent coproporphyrinogen-3 oxidase
VAGREGRPGIARVQDSLLLGLYLHIPFCQAICSYCNFNRGLIDGELKRRYVDALVQEVRTSGVVSCPPGLARETTPDVQPADTIFFGGGTPSILEPAEIARLIGACRDTFALTPDAEITLETNPETATPERLAAFREAGVNRLSFGVQSFDDEELKRLGRIHSSARAVDAIKAAQATGFRSVSFDLMLWLPQQTADTWIRTVEQSIALAPDHLSLYLLELYPNAPLKEEMARAGWSLTPDDDAADMYLEGLARLDAAGYAQYEISNVARAGHRSRHNLKYWQSGDWRGFGCGAHSTVAGVRWKNVSSTADYIERVSRGEDVAQDVQKLSSQARVEEALFTGLRLTDGVDRGAFFLRWDIDPWVAYRDSLEAALEAGHVWHDRNTFGFTRSGMLVANEVLAHFV